MKKFRNLILTVCKKTYNFYANHKVFFFILSAGLVLIGIYVLNYLTPLLADDYNYSFILGAAEQERITGLKDIIDSQRHHYFTWGGRNIALGLTQLFLYWGKPIFNIINTFGYLALTFLIYFHVNTYKRMNVSLYIVIIFLVWFFTPAFGETVFWLTGACVYMWTTLFVLLFLLPYRLYAANPERFRVKPIPAFLISGLLGIIAGWSQENIGGAMILAVCLFFVYCRKNKIKIPIWSITGFCTALIGYILLMTAPGNFVRASTEIANQGLLSGMLFRGVMIIKDLYVNMYFIFLIITILLILYFYFNKEYKTVLSGFIYYFIISLAGVFCVLLSPSAIPHRAWFGAMIFMYIAVGLIFNSLKKSKLERQIKYCFLGFLIIPFCLSYFEALADAVYINSFIAKRTEYVLDQKSKGILDIEVERITAKNEHNPRFTYDDIQDKDFYGNTIFSEYHKINSIRSEKEHLVEGKPYAGFNFSRYRISIPRVCKSCITNTSDSE